MAKPDKAELKKQGEILKQIIAQGRKKTLNFALLQGKDQMYLVTHLKKNPVMLRKEAKKEGGGPKGVTGTFNVEGKNLIFSVEEEPPGPFPKLTKKHFMTRGIPIRVTFKLPNGTVIDDGEPSEDTVSDGEEHGSDDKALAEQEALGASVMGMFNNLQSELEEKMSKAGDDMRATFENLSDQFHQSHIGKQFEESAAHLSELQKKLSEFIEETAEDISDQISGPLALPSEIQKKIDAIIAIGVTEAEIRQKSAEENIKKLVANVVAGVSEAKDNLAELLKPATDKIAEMIATYRKLEAAKDRLKTMDLSDDQTTDLARLALEHPKSFDAAVSALKAMDTNFGDLDATPSGIADLLKKQAEAAALTKVEYDKYSALLDKKDKAFDALEAAKKTQAEAAKKVSATESALVKLKAKLPEDLSKLTPVQKSALAKVLKILQDNKKLYETISADVTAKDAVHKTAEGLMSAQGKIYGGLSDKQNVASKALYAAQVKKKMLDSLSVGALSPDSKNPLKDEDVAKILAALEADTGLGSIALDLVETSKNKEHIAKGAGMLVAGIGNGFKDKDGNSYGDKYTCANYARNALKMGNALGPGYFDNLDGFIDKGGLNKTTTLSYNLSPKKKLEQERAKYIGSAMLGADGKIDTKSQQATDAMDMVNFHPELLANATPGMNMHFAKMAKTMDDPAHKQKCQDALDGITTAPTEDTGRNLIAKATGKAPADVTADDIKNSVMSAMFTPLDQGPVGSCFATAPARNVRAKDPARAMKDMAQIATKGIFTTAQGLDIKAVRTSLGTSAADEKLNKLPADDNPLMRSWEYTIATAGAQSAKSTERWNLDDQLWTTGKDAGPGVQNLNALKPIIGANEWKKVEPKLKALIHKSLTFRYNSTSETGDSADGKSDKGNFEILNKSKFPPKGIIITKENFIKIITALAIDAAGAKSDADLSKKISDHCSSQGFIDSICLWIKGTGGDEDDTRLPWELAAGGFDAPMIFALEGGDPKTKDILGENKKEGKPGHQSQGARTEKIVTALLKNFIGQSPDVDMVTISTGGIHVFEGLPQHPSLEKLKEGGDLAAALEKHLLGPARKLAAKEIDAKTVGVLFDRQIDSYGKNWLHDNVYLEDDEKGAELLAEAQKNRPDEGMTPKKLKEIVDAALKPLIDYQTKFIADKWKADKIAKSEAVSDEDYAKKLKARQKSAESSKAKVFDNTLINTLDPPEFVVADSNWGGPNGHTYFVVIADPVSGQPKLFERVEPSGDLAAMDDEWADTSWKATK